MASLTFGTAVPQLITALSKTISITAGFGMLFLQGKQKITLIRRCIPKKRVELAWEKKNSQIFRDSPSEGGFLIMVSLSCIENNFRFFSEKQSNLSGCSFKKVPDKYVSSIFEYDPQTQYLAKSTKQEDYGKCLREAASAGAPEDKKFADSAKNHQQFNKAPSQLTPFSVFEPLSR